MAEQRPPRLVILGLPYFGTILAEALRERGWNARFLPHPGRSFRGWAGVLKAVLQADLIYLVSARAERGSPLDWLLRYWHVPAVVHWVGTDVLIAAEAHRKGRLSEAVASRALHWTDADWLTRELRDLGVRSEVVPLPVPGLAKEAPPLPETFRVLFYLPVDAFDREVFDMTTMLGMPPELPGVEFILIPSPAETLPGPLPPNLETPGWVTDMDSLYRGVTVVARLVTHDGMPFTVLEAMSRGRHVIYSYELPGVRTARGHDAVKAAIQEMQSAHSRGELGLNEAGMRWVAATYSFEAAAAQIDQRLRQLLGRVNVHG